MGFLHADGMLIFTSLVHSTLHPPGTFVIHGGIIRFYSIFLKRIRMPKTPTCGGLHNFNRCRCAQTRHSFHSFMETNTALSFNPPAGGRATAASRFWPRATPSNPSADSGHRLHHSLHSGVQKPRPQKPLQILGETETYNAVGQKIVASRARADTVVVPYSLDATCERLSLFLPQRGDIRHKLIGAV